MEMGKTYKEYRKNSPQAPVQEQALVFPQRQKD